MTDTATLVALKPCPFCGSDQLERSFTRPTDEVAFWSVECHGCGVAVADDASQAEADRHWNDRAPDPELTRLQSTNAELVAALEDAADGLCAAGALLEIVSGQKSGAVEKFEKAARQALSHRQSMETMK